MTGSRETTVGQIEEGTGELTSFLGSERGGADGWDASINLAKVVSPERAAYEFAADVTRLNQFGYYEILRHDDEVGRVGQFNRFMAGRIVIAPSIRGGRMQLFPAVVSLKSIGDPSNLRLHVLEKPLQADGLTEVQRISLSAAAQSETEGIGQHGRVTDDRVEAEHFLTVMRAAIDPVTARVWSSGTHPNHTWRQQASVLDVVSTPTQQAPSLMPSRIKTVNFKGGLPTGYRLYWHDSLTSGDKSVETGNRANALVHAQGLGYLTLKDTGNVDNLRRLIA